MRNPKILLYNMYPFVLCSVKRKKQINKKHRTLSCAAIGCQSDRLICITASRQFCFQLCITYLYTLYLTQMALSSLFLKFSYIIYQYYARFFVYCRYVPRPIGKFCNYPYQFLRIHPHHAGRFPFCGCKYEESAGCRTSMQA